MKNVYVFSPGMKVRALSESKLSFSEVQRRLDGYIEAYRLGKFYLLFDEEGRLKGLKQSVCIYTEGINLVGDIYVGCLVGQYLEGISKEEFNTLCTRYGLLFA